MRIIFITILAIFILGSEKTVFAVNDRGTPSDRSFAIGRVEPRDDWSDWYNRIGFPQQFFGANVAWFSLGLYFMLAFLKVFLIWGIWPTAEKESPVPVLYGATGYGQDNVYYSYSPWQTYG